MLWPQMSPMWWTSLMFLFILLFILMISFLYFNYMIKIENSVKFTNLKMNWKL
nr:ATP synthase F0 subunit 8 [Kaukania anser]